MKLAALARWTVSFGVLPLGWVIGQPVDPGAGAPDKLTEAFVYARFAAEAFRCEDNLAAADPVGNAKKWTLKAIATAGEAKPPNQAEAAPFLVRQKQHLQAVLLWEQFFKNGPRAVRAALARGDLADAEKRLPREEGPECDRRLQALRQEVAEVRREFDRLVADGNGHVVQHRAVALDRFEAALRLNRDDRQLRERVRALSKAK